MTWHGARVARRAPAAQMLTYLDLEVPAALAAQFIHPGQWVWLQTGTIAESVFAIASPPGQPRFEFLLKAGSPVSDALGALSEGDEARVSDVGGQGFPLEQAVGRPLVLVAAGSGLAPMRSVVAAVRARRHDFREVHLVLGVRTDAHIAWQHEFAGWEKDGIQVTTTVSQGNEAWAGRRGYVQTHLPQSELREAVAFLVGQREMTVAAQAALIARGVDPKRLFLNL